MKKRSLLCCDWGTSNFRLSLLDIATDKVIGLVKSEQGIASTFDTWQSNPSKNRVHFFRAFLNTQVQRLASEVARNLEDIPIILTGMASASIGLEEIRYTTIPFSISQPVLGVKHFPINNTFRNELYLYGGLRTSKDVMRGEEVQLLGLSHLINGPACICILPGTHSKHIWIENKMVVDFQTFMTGECFQLLSTQSILKVSVRKDKTFGESQEAIFKKGVLQAKSGNVLNNLFSVRTNTLLKGVSETANYYYLSGLLIGQELMALQNFKGQLLLIGDKPLVTFYQLALGVLELDQDLTLATATDMEQCIPKAHLKLFLKESNY